MFDSKDIPPEALHLAKEAANAKIGILPIEFPRNNRIISDTLYNECKNILVTQLIKMGFVSWIEGDKILLYSLYDFEIKKVDSLIEIEGYKVFYYCPDSDPNEKSELIDLIYICERASDLEMSHEDMIRDTENMIRIMIEGYFEGMKFIRRVNAKLEKLEEEKKKGRIDDDKTKKTSYYWKK
ncbi:hypothetical protein TREPR_3860 [Treponema primitia ZAS-2]|uniref:Uncharacterized protein n=1 Tax=Treponema primitia (strain ATCC BAA-887 / DSM 12427 / ZAS-2) TaxID=545694 RepID=F5YP34_TREPZ|nr:hypothetical protein [Treponema primitia]AEF86133.1 hypothetical protein TREPR_3860 [Treponema primitia ZAS-2]